MPFLNLEPDQSALLVIDVQAGLIPFVWESARMLDRALFLLRIANLLEVPVLGTEQNPGKMGGTHLAIAEAVGPERTYSKMEFSAARCGPFLDALRRSGRRQLVLIGLETHICVSQTARALIADGYQVWVCPDAVSARSQDRHRLGMEQIRDSGIVPAHTESVAYEWLGTADHPKFREALSIVKAHAV